MRIFPKNYATVIQNLPEYGTTLFFPNNFCSQSSRTGDSEYVSELFFLGNVLLNVLEFETENEKKKNYKKKKLFCLHQNLPNGDWDPPAKPRPLPD